MFKLWVTVIEQNLHMCSWNILYRETRSSTESTKASGCSHPWNTRVTLLNHILWVEWSSWEQGCECSLRTEQIVNLVLRGQKNKELQAKGQRWLSSKHCSCLAGGSWTHSFQLSLLDIFCSWDALSVNATHGSPIKDNWAVSWRARKTKTWKPSE